MKKWHFSFFMALWVSIALILGACSSDALQEDEKVPGAVLKEKVPSTEIKGFIPSADGAVVYKSEAAVIDASNISCGYVIVDYLGKNDKVKLQVTGPDGNTYTYNLYGGNEVFPLTAGNGKYSLCVYENTGGTLYALSFSKDIEVMIRDELSPYLYPNQYVWFTADSKTVHKAEELVSGEKTEEKMIESIYDYVIENIVYDQAKAKCIRSDYLPHVDKILESGKGICFDYAALMVAMLRSQNIPTRMEVGYNGEKYHAWISVYIRHKGWVNGVIELKDNEWLLMDPTFAASSKSPREFTTQDKDYIVKYVY